MFSQYEKTIFKELVNLFGHLMLPLVILFGDVIERALKPIFSFIYLYSFHNLLVLILTGDFSDWYFVLIRFKVKKIGNLISM